MKNILHSQYLNTHQFIFLNERPSGQKTEKVDVKGTLNPKEKDNKTPNNEGRKDLILDVHRKELESEFHDVAKKTDVVKDIRLWKDNTYNYDMAMKSRTNISSVLHVIKVCESSAGGELERAMLKSVLGRHKDLSVLDLKLLRELPIYLNPNSTAQSWNIKEGFHSSIPAIAIDYTEDEEGILDDILDGLEGYKKWLNV